MFEEERLRVLTQFGLTALQARVYLALIESGNSTARIAAKKSQVARQEVYRVINELLDAGLLTKVITKPTKYKPMPLDESVKFFLNENRKRMTMLETEAGKMLQTIFNEEETMQTLPKEYEFREMQKNDKWFRSVNINAGLKTADIINSARRYSQALLSSDYHEEALRTGTKMRVIVENVKIDTPVFKKILTLKKYPFYEIRFVPFEPKALFSLRDKKEVYLITKPSQPRGPPYLISNHPCLVELAQKYFDTMWRRAIKFDDYIKKEEKISNEDQFDKEDMPILQEEPPKIQSKTHLISPEDQSVLHRSPKQKKPS